ncbi:MAG: YheU family protein [Sandaracinaceae bacterium]|nr:MAG: YheU family protein [Sandaracinaceae bacterium]HBQ11054.1 hypothetical protein [Myxococcales bacterium]
MRIPPERLSPDALAGVIDDFVLREGTDYGHDEPTLDRKRAEVRRQLDDEEIVVVFDPKTETVNLMLERDLPSGMR